MTVFQKRLCVFIGFLGMVGGVVFLDRFDTRLYWYDPDDRAEMIYVIVISTILPVIITALAAWTFNGTKVSGDGDQSN